MPIGSLSRLTIALLQCTENEKVSRNPLTANLGSSSNALQIEGHVDPIIRSLEVSVVPHIQKLGCQLGCGLAEWCVLLRFQLAEVHGYVL